MAKKTKASIKSNDKKRSEKPPRPEKPIGAPFNEQDPKRRLGNFGGAGEHPRQGGRTSGIVGQTKQHNHTDKAAKKK